MHQTMSFPNLILIAQDVRVIGIDPVLLTESIKILKACPSDNSV